MKYQRLNKVLADAGFARGYCSRLAHRLIADKQVTIAWTDATERGDSHFVPEEEAERIRRAYARPTVAPAPEGAEETPAQLHLGALETKLDRLEQRVLGLEQALNVLIKGSNVIADRLARTLEALGETPGR